MAKDLLTKRESWLEEYSFRLRPSERGTVISVGDGIAWLSGLPSASIDEVVEFADGSEGLVFHLARDRVGVILLRQTGALAAGVTR